MDDIFIDTETIKYYRNHRLILYNPRVVVNHVDSYMCIAYLHLKKCVVSSSSLHINKYSYVAVDTVIFNHVMLCGHVRSSISSAVIQVRSLELFQV